MRVKARGRGEVSVRGSTRGREQGVRALGIHRGGREEEIEGGRE